MEILRRCNVFLFSSWWDIWNRQEVNGNINSRHVEDKMATLNTYQIELSKHHISHISKRLLFQRILFWYKIFLKTYKNWQYLFVKHILEVSINFNKNDVKKSVSFGIAYSKLHRFRKRRWSRFRWQQSANWRLQRITSAFLNNFHIILSKNLTFNISYECLGNISVIIKAINSSETEISNFDTIKSRSKIWTTFG